MKKAILLFSTLLILFIAGCGNSDTATNDSNTEQADTSANIDSTATDETEAKETPTEDAETILDTYYSARQAKDYETMGKYMSEKNFIYSNVSKEDYLKDFEQNDFINNVEVAEFNISQLEDFDEGIKYAEVLSKGTINGEDSSAKDILYLVQENNQWKVDFTGVSSTKTVDTPNSNEVSEFSNIEIFHLYNNDVQIRFKWSNKLTDSGISIGWANHAIATLKTDQGEYQATLHNEKLAAGASFEQYNLYFQGIQGEPQSITISGIYITDKRGLPDPSQDPIDLTMNLQ